MKNFIQLSLTAFIFLCGCKSNSFMKQRYTNFAHTHTKPCNKEKPAIKRTESKPFVIQETQVAVNEPEQQPVLLSTADPITIQASTTKIKYAQFPERLISLVVTSGSRTFSSLREEVKKSNSESFAKRKTIKEKLKSLTGVFNTIFKIVLFAIILAILVAIIIIIILT